MDPFLILIFLIFAVSLSFILGILSFMTFTKCPKCDRKFRVSRSLKYGYYPFKNLGPFKFKSNNRHFTFSNVRFAISNFFEKLSRNEKSFSFFGNILNPSLVVCPNCGNQYIAPEHKYIGRMQLVYAYFVLAFNILLFLLIACLPFII